MRPIRTRDGAWRLVRRLMRLAVAAAVLVALFPVGASARSSSPVVMTRNLYLGADLTPIVDASDPGALLVAAADIYESAIATSFPDRAGLLAQEIADTSPDLIGLQEVALWRTGTLGDPSDAMTVAIDFLGLLLAELDALGENYEVAIVQSTFDAEAPATVSTAGTPVFTDVRLTIRNVILVRSGVSWGNARSGHYDTNVVYPDVGGSGNDVVDLRGWVAVNAAMEPKGKPFVFVNTHLEPFAAPVRSAQAQELVDGPLHSNLKVIAVGDFNSPPTGPESGAYQILTSRRNGKMHDAWVAANGDDDGFTFGQAPDLANPDSTASTRIDHVFTRTAAVGAREATLVGSTARTGGGLWASDHFGVVAVLSMP